MPAIIEYNIFLGISRRLHETNRPKGFGVYALDVDFSRGTLKPLRNDRPLSVDTGNTVYLDNCCFKTYAECVRIVDDTVGCKRVFAVGVPGYDYPVQATPEEMCQDNWCRLGFDCVMPPPSVWYSGGASSDKAIPRSYFYTYVNKYGEESAPSSPSEVVLKDWNASASLSGITSPPAELCVTKIRIYAMVPGMEAGQGAQPAGDSGYYLVGEIEAGDTTFSHNMASSPTIGPMNMTEEYDAIPATAFDISHWGTNQLAFLSGDTIRFTEPWNYSVAPEKYKLRLSDNPLRLLTTSRYAYVLGCGSAEVIDVSLDCDQGGCKGLSLATDRYPLIGVQSPATYGNSVIYATNEGIVALEGVNSSILTKDVLTRDQFLEMHPHTMRGVVHNGYYYGATDTHTFRLAINNQSQAESFSYLSIRPKAFYVTKDNRLIYTDEDGTWEFGEGDGVRPYVFETQHTVSNRPLIASSAMFHAACGKLEYDVEYDSKKCTTKTAQIEATAKSLTRLPRWLSYSHRVRIKGTAEVYAFSVDTGTVGQ